MNGGGGRGAHNGIEYSKAGVVTKNTGGVHIIPGTGAYITPLRVATHSSATVPYRHVCVFSDRREATPLEAARKAHVA